MRRHRIPIKSPREIEAMRVAGKTAAAILLALAREVTPGRSTGEIDRMAAELMRENDCRSAFLNYRGFSGHICISVNEEVVHGIGGPRRIMPGDIVKIDVGIIKGGFIGDNATTVAAGDIPMETKLLLAATEQSLFEAISHARAGRRLADLCGSVEAFVKPRGFTVVREFVGHGVASVRILDDGWTVITEDRKPSAHFEHTVLVTDGDPEILTWRPREALPEMLGLPPL
jgi:methionyl aminopeptidase